MPDRQTIRDLFWWFRFVVTVWVAGVAIAIVAWVIGGSHG